MRCDLHYLRYRNFLKLYTRNSTEVTACNKLRQCSIVTAVVLGDGYNFNNYETIEPYEVMVEEKGEKSDKVAFYHV